MVYFPQYKFEIYRKTLSGAMNPTPEILTGFTSLDYVGGIETTKDVLTTKFSNFTTTTGSWSKTLGGTVRANNFIGVDDEIKLYAYYGIALPTVNDDALLIAGRVTGFDYKPEGEGFTYTVKIVNRTEELLNTMIPYSSRATSGVANTSPSAIKQMIARLNRFNPSKNIYAFFHTEINPFTGSYGNITRWRTQFSGSNNDGFSGNAFRDTSLNISPAQGVYLSTFGSVFNYSNGLSGRITAASGSSITTDTQVVNDAHQRYEVGIPFPTIEYNETWKPIYYNIEKLSSSSYTDDENAGEYIFYVKYIPVLPALVAEHGTSINELVWKPKSLINSGTLVDGSHIHNVNINLDVREIQNLLIVNAGTDRRGNGITTVAFDTASMGKFGVKTGYYTASRRVFSEIHRLEMIHATNVLGLTIDSDGMPVSGFPITMSFKERDETGNFTNNSLSANSKTVWNQYLRDEAKSQARAQANKVLEKLGEPRYALTADLVVGSNNIIAGDIYTFVVNSFGWEGTTVNPGFILRVKDIQHTLENNGWTTRIQASEDEKVVSQRLGNKKSSVNNE